MKQIRIDRFKVKKLMKKLKIQNLKELSTRSGLSVNTVYSVMDSYDWRGTTLNALSIALACRASDLLTIDEGE
jgi:DNA-binding Xre family transcriptional regulator